MLFTAATALAALAASPVLAGPPHRAAANKRHAGLAASRRAQAAHAPLSRRTVHLGKRADGTTCKSRGVASSSVSSSAYVATSIESSYAPAETSPVVETSSTEEAAPSTTEAQNWVAPTTWAAETTSTTEAWVAPTTTSVRFLFLLFCQQAVGRRGRA